MPIQNAVSFLTKVIESTGIQRLLEIIFFRLGQCQSLSTTAIEANSNKDTPPEEAGEAKPDSGPSEAELKLTEEKVKLESNYKELEVAMNRGIASARISKGQGFLGHGAVLAKKEQFAAYHGKRLKSDGNKSPITHIIFLQELQCLSK
jgi:hypothetical protein